MKTAVILGAGQMGQAARRLLNRNKIALAAFGDNSPQKWNREAVPPVLPLAEALALRPEIAIVGVLDEERSAQLTEQARKLGFEGAFLRMSDAAEQIDVRAATMRRISARLRAEKTEALPAVYQSVHTTANPARDFIPGRIFHSALRNPLFPEKMKITAISAVPQCFRARKADFLQPTVCYVVSVAKQAAQLRAAVFRASRMPETLFYRNVKGALPAALFTLP